MDTVVDLVAILRHEIADYVRPSPNSVAYYLENAEKQVFSVVGVPADRAKRPVIMLMARVDHDNVIIEADITNKPLHVELKRAGIPADQITLAYEGAS